MDTLEAQNVTAEIQMLMQAGFIVNELLNDTVDTNDEAATTRTLELIDARLKAANDELRRLWIEHRNFANMMQHNRRVDNENSLDGQSGDDFIPF